MKTIYLQIDKDEKALFELLLEEVGYKKSFSAMNDTECNACYGTIFEGDTFYFIGNKSKLCEDCRGNLESILEDALDKMK